MKPLLLFFLHDIVQIAVHGKRRKFVDFEYFFQWFVEENLSFVGGVLQVVALDVLPQFLHQLSNITKDETDRKVFTTKVQLRR